MREIPGLQGGVGEAEALPPEVEDLLIEAEADQGPQLDVHPRPSLVVGVVDEVDASVQQLLGAQHLPILLQSVKIFLHEIFPFWASSYLKVLQSTSLENTDL